MNDKPVVLADPDDFRLARNQEIRDTIIGDMTAEGMPTGESLDMLLKILDSSDRSAFTKKKLKVEETKLKNDSENQRAIAEVLRQHKARKQVEVVKEFDLPSDFIMQWLVPTR